MMITKALGAAVLATVVGAAVVAELAGVVEAEVVGEATALAVALDAGFELSLLPQPARETASARVAAESESDLQ